MIEGGDSKPFDLHFPHKSDIGQTNPDVFCGRWSGTLYDSGACDLISRNATHSRCRCNQGKNPNNEIRVDFFEAIVAYDITFVDTASFL